MTTSDLIKQLFICFSKRDNEAFEAVAREYIQREKRKKHIIVARELEKALYNSSVVWTSNGSKFNNGVEWLNGPFDYSSYIFRLADVTGNGKADIKEQLS